MAQRTVNSRGDESLTRRSFLRSGAAASVAAGLMLNEAVWAGQEAEGEKQRASKPLSKRTLGRTGLEVTDISFGGIQITQERLLDLAIDRGINLIHTSPGYGGGRSIDLFGKVMKRRRKEVYLALKQSPISGIDKQLKILNTDYVDLLVPPLHTVERMNNADLPGAYEKLQKEGKIRYTGYACHKNIADVMNRSIDLGFFDVMLIAYNLPNREALDPILARAVKDRKMGFMSMKATKDLDRSSPEGMTAGYASLLKNPNVHTLLLGMGTFSDVECNVSASGKSLGLLDRMRLIETERLAAAACTMCGACDVCPRGVAVSDIIRHKLYRDRGEDALAADAYRGLPPEMSSAACDGCGDCDRACPRGLTVQSHLRATHEVLV